MRQALLLLPDLALFLVICRMATVGLHSRRPDVFVFLCAWFLFCISTVVIGRAIPHTSALYAKIFSGQQIAMLLILLWPALSLSRSLTKNGFDWIASAICFLAILVAWKLPSGLEMQIVLAAFGICFVLASIGASESDVALWRGLGAYLLIYGIGVVLAWTYGTSAAAYEWVAFATAAVWIAVALKIGPTHDAIVNPDKLVVVPAARWFFGLARSARG